MPYLAILIQAVQLGEIAVPALMRIVAAWKNASGATDAELKDVTDAILLGVSAKCAEGIAIAEAEIAAAQGK